MTWEIVFMLLILKVPIVYLCVVVWWAIKAEPSPPDLAAVVVPADTAPPGSPRWRDQLGRRRPSRPHTPGLGAGASAQPKRERGVTA
jgi:hypothetical protein